MKIYILLRVTYDYHTFTENIAVSIDKGNLINYRNDLPLFNYKMGDDIEFQLKENGVSHYYIAEFDNV